MKPLERLREFAAQNEMLSTRGALNVGLVMTRRARDEGLPLDADDHVAPSGSQVRGLNGKAGNKVLFDHGVTQSIGTEAGRTNRGAVAQMRAYVGFLNEESKRAQFDLDEFEGFWVEQVNRHFATKPFKLRREQGASIQSIIRDLMEQALDRQRKGAGAMVLGTMLQHLVGAKLEAALAGSVSIKHHGANVSDNDARGGDFDIGNTAIHVTASPSDLLLKKCRKNLHSSIRPMIVTTPKGVSGAENLVENQGLQGRIEIYSADQFISLNINELGVFSDKSISDALYDVINRYNRIVSDHEDDPSLCIEWT